MWTLRVRAALQAGTVAVIGVLIGVASILSPAAVAESRNENIVYYEGDPEFCPRLLHEADKVEYVEPVFPAAQTFPQKVGPFPRSDDPDGPYYPTRLYFLDTPPPAPSGKLEWDDLLAVLKKDDWRKRLFEPSNAPPRYEGDTFQFYYYMVYDPIGQWRALNAQCPDILILNRADPRWRVAPEQFALYDVDLDNDGERETVLYTDHPGVGRHTSPHNHSLEIVDLKTCSKTTFVENGRERFRLLRFAGTTYLVSSRSLRPIPYIVVTESKPGKPVYGPSSSDWCVFDGLRELSGFNAERMTLKRKETK